MESLTVHCPGEGSEERGPVRACRRRPAGEQRLHGQARPAGRPGTGASAGKGQSLLPVRGTGGKSPRRCIAVPGTATVRLLRQPAGRRGFPRRTLHLVDIENLSGMAIPSRPRVALVQALYLGRVGVAAGDHVVMATSHLGLMNAALGWPRARYMVRSGPDGADLELLDVLLHEDVAARFTRVVIGSGDGVFGLAAGNLAAGGVSVTVACRPGSLSRHLRRAARDVVYLDVPEILESKPA